MIYDTTYTIIMSEINKIITMNISDWNIISIENKIKILHNMCKNYKSDKSDRNKGVIFSLKSLKPKKLIQYCNFSNLYNKIYYNEFKKNILDYTFEFRSKYVDKKKRVYYTYNNLSTIDYNKIIIDYNKIVYNFLVKYQKYINFDLLYDILVGNNKDKLIVPTNKYNCGPIRNYDSCISIKDDVIILQFNKNIIISMKLILNSNVITNNLPMLYSITVNNDYSA